jgi:hypothetical protein
MFIVEAVKLSVKRSQIFFSPFLKSLSIEGDVWYVAGEILIMELNMLEVLEIRLNFSIFFPISLGVSCTRLLWQLFFFFNCFVLFCFFVVFW